MATAVSWLLGTVLMFLVFGVLTCSALGRRRRSRFYARLGCATVVMSAVAVVLAFAIKFSTLPQRAFGLVWVALLLAALVVAPVFCYHTFAPFQGSSEDDGGGGPGSGPPPPRSGPSRGGAPLPDADQARTRRRDHNRPSPRGVSRRQPPVEPVRPGTPAGRGRR
jgi:multisubunit Na+/H+ antiporter MnhG subunit